MSERLIVIGGDAAGMTAASQARRLRDADDLAITAFERGSITSYSACGIPYWVAGMIDERDDLVVRRPETFRDRYDIDVAIRSEVVAIDTEAATVTVRDLDAGSERVEAYDQLVVATGAVPTRPDLPGLDARGVFGIQTLDDGAAVLDALHAREPQRAVVVGGGYIGLEMAEALFQRGLEVHLVEAGDHPMKQLDAPLGDLVAEAMRDLGIELHLGEAVEAVEVDGDGWARQVVTEAGRLDADLVVLGLGTEPASGLAAAAGIEIGPSGGIATDRRMGTQTDGVWAAGDCAETFHRVSEQPVTIALGTIANRQGRVLGRNLGGEHATFPGVLGTAVTKVCGTEIARTGLSTRQAEAAGFAVLAETTESTTRAHYYPGAEPISVRLIAEAGSGRLLGAQIVGKEGAAKRIDVLATALWNGMTVPELVDVDLSYAPPFSPVWDPVLSAARSTARALR